MHTLQGFCGAAARLQAATAGARSKLCCRALLLPDTESGSKAHQGSPDRLPPPGRRIPPPRLESGHCNLMAKRKSCSKERRNGSRVKTKRRGLELSDLPLDILQYIISLLPIKEAARTSVLSKHWKRVWCSRRILEFSCKSLSYKKKPGTPRRLITEQVFIERVNSILKQHTGVGVVRMEVDFSRLHNEHSEHIDGWMSFAIASKTKQLALDFTFIRPTDEPYSFPFQLFDATNGSYLQSMKLASVSLKQPSNIEFLLNLRKLELVDVKITDEELGIMLCNCKVLEFLGISRWLMLTSLRIPDPLNHLKHLHVSHCPSLQEIELNFGLITLEYEGLMIALAPPSTLRNICIKSSDICSALPYIFTELPSTLPRLEMLTLGCQEIERATSLHKPLKFIYLRHLRLELNFVSQYETKRATDVLDLACLLEAAPSMEKLEIHMWVAWDLARYRKHHGELRSLPSQPHRHLKLVNMTGFYGQKDQVELALHILRNATVLEAMKIDPKPMVAAIYAYLNHEDSLCFVDGYRAAKKYLCKADYRGVLDVIRVRRRDVKNVSASKLVDPIWIDLLAEDE